MIPMPTYFLSQFPSKLKWKVHDLGFELEDFELEDFELEAADLKSRDCSESIGWAAEAASKHKDVGARGSICWPG